MSSQTFPPLSAGFGSAGAGTSHDVIADLAKRQPAIVGVPIALALFSLLALTVVVTHTGEQFSLDE